MPACTLNLIVLKPETTLSTFLDALPTPPLVCGQVHRFIIIPTTLSTQLLSTPWQYLVILPSASSLPTSASSLLQKHWSVTAGIPGRLTTGFAEKNQRLLHPQQGDVPPLTGSLSGPLVASNAQSLEFTDELEQWARGFGARDGNKAVSMLNLLAFKEGKKEDYLKYGEEFGKGIGARRGGVAKLVGTVLDYSDKPAGGKAEWDEIALAHYPSIQHFLDMTASEDYQTVNKKWRLPSLKDTFILCTTDIELDSAAAKSKL